MRFRKRAILLICLAAFIVSGFCLTANAASFRAPEVKASNISASGKVKLKWNKVSGATKYKVYRASSEKGSYKLLKTVSDTSYTHSSGGAGKQYYYYVRAVNKSGKLSAKSNVVKKYCKLKQPSVKKITNVSSNGKVKLTWNPVEGAVSYKVYRATSKSGTYKLMKTTEGLSYTNTTAKAGQTYYYKIKAIASVSSANSAYSKIVSRTCRLKRPAVSASLNGKGQPKLEWNPIESADQYMVYRSEMKTTGYELVKTTSETSYTNTAASLDCTYYYKVKAVCAETDTDSAFSVPVSVKTRDFEIRYVLPNRIYAYVEPTSKSDSVEMPYMAEFKLGKTVYDYSSGKWYQISYEGKTLYLWVEKGDRKFTEKESSYDYTSDNPYVQEVLDLAKTICFEWDTYYTNDDSTGIPDKNGRYGFDCSGYVTYCINTVMQKYNPAYRLVGYTQKLYEQDAIYNDGYKGAFYSQDVTMKNLQPGDLIFLDMSGNGMNHVAMYMGNGELSHISGSAQGVSIMPLQGSFEEKVVGIKRFIPDQMISADEMMYATVGWCKLYEKRSDESEVLYTFSKNESLTLLFTNSAGNWAYVTTTDGTKAGFVLTKFLSKTKVK